jgi:hypothetical protein
MSRASDVLFVGLTRPLLLRLTSGGFRRYGVVAEVVDFQTGQLIGSGMQCGRQDDTGVILD